MSRTNSGFTRGSHDHDLKVEKRCLLESDAVIRFRLVLGGDGTGHRVSGTEFEVMDISPGVTHSIENGGTIETIVPFWASEILDPQQPERRPLDVGTALER